MPHFDVLIVGAGIVGAACARECASAGLRVGVVEALVPGSGATAAGMGHVVVMDDSPAQLALTRYSQQQWQAILPALPPAVEYEERGTLWVAADEEEIAEVYTKHQTYASAGVRTEILDAAALRRIEPNLRTDLAGALLVPEDSVVYPPAAAAFFLESAIHAGAELLRGKAVVSFGAGVAMLNDGTRVAADRIILATGADRSLIPMLPIQKRKGHLVITDRYPGFRSPPAC